MAEEAWGLAILLFVIIGSAFLIIATLISLRKSKWSLCVLAILFGSTTIYITSLASSDASFDGQPPPIFWGLLVGILPLITIGPILAVFFGEESIFSREWESAFSRDCYICKKDRGKCVCPPAPQKLSKKEQREMDLMAYVAIEELLEKTSSRSCSNGTGFWGVGKCSGTPVHACKRCWTYVCSMHVSKMRTYKGAYVCATCNRNMSDTSD